MINANLTGQPEPWTRHDMAWHDIEHGVCSNMWGWMMMPKRSVGVEIVNASPSVSRPHQSIATQHESMTEQAIHPTNLYTGKSRPASRYMYNHPVPPP
jgi:hypothetical protein